MHPKTSYNWVWPLANTLALAFMLTINVLANALPINGLDTGEVAYSYPNYFIPAGFTFGIWGLIYLLLIAFVLYSWLAKAPLSQQIIRQASPWFILSSVANGIWIFAWHHLLPGYALLIMLLLLISLLLAYVRIRANGARLQDKWFVFLPFSIYLGWICIAIIANVSAYLTHIGWEGGSLSELRWTILMMGVGTLLAFFFLARFRDPMLPLVVLWALFGLWSTFGEATNTLQWTALVLMISIVVALLGGRRAFVRYFSPR